MSSADNITWTGTFTPTANTEDDNNTLSLATSYTDTAGNAGPEATTANYAVDTLAPTLAETTLVPSITNDNSTQYTFSSSEGGTISIGGSCSSDNNTALADNMTVSFAALADGTYSDCTITVTDGAGNTQTISVNTFTIDTVKPVLAQIIAVTTPTNDNTSSYTFSSTEAGNITYGVCSGSPNNASADNNTITFDALADGTYSDCKISVTDNASNTSDNLSVSSFTIDTVKPVLAQVTAVTTPTKDPTPGYAFSSNEAGTISYGGCSQGGTSADNGTNSISFGTLSEGSYSCTITVTDSAGNASSTLNVNTFVVDTTAPAVASISPTDSQTGVSVSENISVTFSESMDTTSVTTNTDNTTCYGSIQLSSDNFNICVQMSTTPSSSNSNKTFTLDPSAILSTSKTYKTRVTTGVKDTASNNLSSQYETSSGFTTVANFLLGGSFQGQELSLTGLVTTLAGSSSGSTDATGTSASFNNPYGITTDGTNLYVTDSNNHRIRKIVISTGVVTTLAGQSDNGSTDATGTSASFYKPREITTDGTNLYVADFGNHRIRKIVISTGVVTTLAGSSQGSTDGTGTSATFDEPYGITTDGTNLYVAESGEHKIRKIVIDNGTVTTLAGTGSQGNEDTAPGTSARFYRPQGITTDGTNLYVSDYSNHRIRKIVIDNGTVTTLAGSSSGSTDATGTSASFKKPRGITTDGTNLYVVDDNHRIRKIVIDNGTVTTLAGNSGGYNDATGTSALFDEPFGITTDGTNLYVADWDNHRIRKISRPMWSQEAYIKASNNDENDNFGYEIAMDGNTLAVTARYEDSNQTTITNGTSSSSNNSNSNSGAVYIYKRTGTSWTQEAYIKASNSGVNDTFGSYVALDNDTLAVTARQEDSNQTTITNGTSSSSNNSNGNSGAVYIYKRTGTSWTQEAYLKASNNDENDYFGHSTALDDDTLAVGAFTEDSNQTTITNDNSSSSDNSRSDSGAVYVYKRTGTSWAQEAYIKSSNNDNGANGYSDSFGFRIALDNETLAVGAYGEDSNQTTITNGTSASSDNSEQDSGAVYVYKRTGSSWAQEAYLKTSNSDDHDLVGYRVALDGDTLAVTARSDDSNQTTITNGTSSSTNNSNTYAGAVFVYKRTGSSWAQEAYIKASNNDASDFFGQYVELDKDTLAVGSTGEDSNQTTITNDNSTASSNNDSSSSGAVYVYKRTGTTWAQEAYIKASNNGEGDSFGSTIALVDNETLAVGASGEDSDQSTITNGISTSSNNNSSNSGAVYVYSFK